MTVFIHGLLQRMTEALRARAYCIIQKMKETRRAGTIEVVAQGEYMQQCQISDGELDMI